MMSEPASNALASSSIGAGPGPKNDANASIRRESSDFAALARFASVGAMRLSPSANQSIQIVVLHVS